MLRILNLGAGVQSTTLYLWAIDGQLVIDRAIFADTGDEPRAVYDHLEFLRSLNGPPIDEVRNSKASLGENLKSGMPEQNGRYIGIPTYLMSDDDQAGLGGRQCTSEFKIKPINKRIRELCGLAKGERSKGPQVTQVMGLSFDEPKRVANVKTRFQSIAWSKPEFPLFDEYMTRADCVAYLEKRLPGYKVPRSACVYCPFHSDSEWINVKSNPDDWARALEVDKILRDPTSACNTHYTATQYLHKSCKPLDEVDFQPKAPDKQGRLNFSTFDCEGMCGV